MKTPRPRLLPLALSIVLLAGSPEWGDLAAFAGTIAASASPAPGMAIPGMAAASALGGNPAAPAAPLLAANLSLTLNPTLFLPTAPFPQAGAMARSAVAALPDAKTLTPAAPAAAETAFPEAQPEGRLLSDPAPRHNPRSAVPAEAAGPPSERTPAVLRPPVLKEVGALLDELPPISRLSPDLAYEAGHGIIDSLLASKAAPPRSGLPSRLRARPLGDLAPGLSPSPAAATAADPHAAAAEPGGLAAKLRAKTRVFQDPGRNKAFWRYFLGFQFAVAGLQFCSVAFPYLIKSCTLTAIPAGVRAAMSSEDFDSRVNRWRSMIRVFQVGAQILSYLSLSFLPGRGQEGNKRVLVRAGLLRAAVLTLVPLHVFFFFGLLPAAAAFAVLAAIFAVQAFFEGIHGGMTDALGSGLIGSPDVTQEERDRANSLLTFTAALVSILVPVLAGKLAQIPDILGRMGTGSSLIFAIYAGVMALSSAFYALITVRAAKAESRTTDGDRPAALVRTRQVLKAVFQNRFLRTLLLLDGFAILIGDPLMISVLPTFVEGVLAGSAGGGLFGGMVNTPMAFFGLLVAFGSAGSALASALNRFVLGWLRRLGYAGEESRLLPLYGIASLEVFAFAGMILLPSFWPVLLFWMAKSLAGGFAGVSRQGVYQKNLAAYPEAERPAIIATLALANLLMTLASTLVYLFVLSAIPIAMSMIIAVAAMAALGALRIGAPYLMFDKAQRSRRPGGYLP